MQKEYTGSFWDTEKKGTLDMISTGKIVCVLTLKADGIKIYTVL
jgi:hypothetical protein